MTNQNPEQSLSSEVSGEKTMVLLDWTSCIKKSNNNITLARELLRMFQDELELMAPIIDEYYTSQATEPLKRIMHQLKGAHLFIDVPRLKKISLKIHDQVYGAALLDWELLASDFHELKITITQTLERLKLFFKNKEAHKKNVSDYIINPSETGESV